METQALTIHGIPGMLWGEPSSRLILSVHGVMGSRLDAAWLAEVAVPLGYRVLSFDLPGHGDRASSPEPLTPMQAAVEFPRILAYAQSLSEEITLHAVSIGAYFSLLTLADAPLRQALLVSPVTDMRYMIEGMMRRADVTPDMLHQAGELPGADGATLSWAYYDYVCAHPITRWEVPTAILAGSEDEVMSPDVTRAVAGRLHMEATFLPGAHHYLHTSEDCAALRAWAEARLRRD